MAQLTYSHRMEKELIRLERNRDRRHAREKQKAGPADDNPASPNPVATPAATGSGGAGGGGGGRGGPGTQRKCANCGQIGHIKTNKKCVRAFRGSPARIAMAAFPLYR